MIVKGLGKGILIFSIISFVFAGIANAGENKAAKLSKEESEKLALEHQTNGNKYDDNGKFKDAIEEYKKSLEYSPNNADTLFNLGVIYLKTNKPQDAVTTFEKLVIIFLGLHTKVVERKKRQR
ncbi:MAG: tetratricopeptide repeat protein [Deltaproteobacteria bacterium]|nr:tetratricopeptide repeat protein [Deltaproteobacteria bacterium]